MIDKDSVLKEYITHAKHFKPLTENVLKHKALYARKLLEYLEKNNIPLSSFTREQSDKYLAMIKHGTGEWSSHKPNETGYFKTREFVRFLEWKNFIPGYSISGNAVPGNAIPGKSISFAELLERYIRRISSSKEVSERTLDITRSLIRRFLEYLENNNITDIARVDKKAVSGYALYLLVYKGSRGKSKIQKPYNVTTRANILVNVRNFFKFLCSENIILTDPSKSVEIPKVPKRISRDIPTLAEIDRLISSIEMKSHRGVPYGSRDIAIIETLYGSAIRVKELVNLDIGNVDFTEKLITVYKGKNRKDRAVPINDTALSYIRDYLKERPEGAPHNPALFLSVFKKRMTVNLIGGLIKKYALKAGIKKHLIPHSFRYACATHMLKNGADIRYIQEMLGHTSLDTTETYTRVVKGDLKRMLRAFHPRENAQETSSQEAGNE